MVHHPEAAALFLFGGWTLTAGEGIGQPPAIADLAHEHVIDMPHRHDPTAPAMAHDRLSHTRMVTAGPGVPSFTTSKWA